MNTRKLERLSKHDLIWVINRILTLACFYRADYYLDHALADLQYEKEMAQIAQAKKYGQKADEKRMEYVSLLAQYDGRKYADIPLDVLEKAKQLIDEAEAAERKFAKLIGLEKTS